jgi:HK97 gp10 family phage protein
MSAQLERLRKRLEAIPANVKEAVRPALQKSGDELANRMRSLAPEDTGDLIESIAVTMGPGRTPPYSQPGGSKELLENQVAITVGNSAVRYPHLVEYGTAKAAAQPFFWPAYRLLRRKIQNRLRRSVSRAVKAGWNGTNFNGNTE